MLKFSRIPLILTLAGGLGGLALPMAQIASADNVGCTYHLRPVYFPATRQPLCRELINRFQRAKEAGKEACLAAQDGGALRKGANQFIRYGARKGQDTGCFDPVGQTPGGKGLRESFRNVGQAELPLSNADRELNSAGIGYGMISLDFKKYYRTCPAITRKIDRLMGDLSEELDENKSYSFSHRQAMAARERRQSSRSNRGYGSGKDQVLTPTWVLQGGDPEAQFRQGGGKGGSPDVPNLGRVKGEPAADLPSEKGSLAGAPEHRFLQRQENPPQGNPKAEFPPSTLSPGDVTQFRCPNSECPPVPTLPVTQAIQPRKRKPAQNVINETNPAGLGSPAAPEDDLPPTASAAPAGTGQAARHSLEGKKKPRKKPAAQAEADQTRGTDPSGKSAGKSAGKPAGKLTNAPESTLASADRSPASPVTPASGVDSTPSKSRPACDPKQSVRCARQQWNWDKAHGKKGARKDGEPTLVAVTSPKPAADSLKPDKSEKPEKAEKPEAVAGAVEPASPESPASPDSATPATKAGADSAVPMPSTSLARYTRARDLVEKAILEGPVLPQDSRPQQGSYNPSLVRETWLKIAQAKRAVDAYRAATTPGEKSRLSRIALEKATEAEKLSASAAATSSRLSVTMASQLTTRFDHAQKDLAAARTALAQAKAISRSLDPSHVPAGKDDVGLMDLTPQEVRTQLDTAKAALAAAKKSDPYSEDSFNAAHVARIDAEAALKALQTVKDSAQAMVAAKDKQGLLYRWTDGIL